MGTKHLICAVKDNEYKVAQYGQWDGYPEGQGVSVLSFLKSDKVESLKKNLDKCRFYTNDETDELNREWGEKSQHEKDEYLKSFDAVVLHRDTSAGILDLIANSEIDVIRLRNDLSFANSSLFCEWAYVIDFDKNTLEVYEGVTKNL